MQIRLTPSLLLPVLSLLQTISGVVSTFTPPYSTCFRHRVLCACDPELIVTTQAAYTATTGSISSNVNGNAFAAVFELVNPDTNVIQVVYYASNLNPVTPRFVSTSVQLTYDNMTQLTGTQYIAEGSVGEGSLSFVLAKGAVIQATIREEFQIVDLVDVRHGYWNSFDAFT